MGTVSPVVRANVLVIASSGRRAFHMSARYGYYSLAPRPVYPLRSHLVIVQVLGDVGRTF